MTIKNSTRLLAILLTIAMMIPFASCNVFQGAGSLKLESFTVDTSTIKTQYYVGEEIDFSGIQAIAKYNDENLNKTYTYAELTFSDTANLTAKAGTYTVTVSFMDPNLQVKQEAQITITVLAGAPEVTTPVETPEATTPVETPEETTPVETPEETTPVETPEDTTPVETPEDTTPVETPEETTPPETTPEETYEVVEFLKPSELVHFDAANDAAGTLTYGQPGFSGQFTVGDQVYVIGNQNEFKLNPGFAIWSDEADDVVDVAEFFATVTLSVKNGDAYVELTAKAKGNNLVEYYEGDVLLATVNTYRGTYQFTAAAAGKQVKISVLPSETHYLVDGFNPVVLEAKIINAYNIYEAWQLAVIDNYNTAWTDFKTAHGIANVSVSGIVLHKNIKLTVEDVPASFFYTTTSDVVYYKTNEDGTLSPAVTIPAGTKYLIDSTMIYERHSTEDFAMEGNFFTVDTKGFPLIPSPAVFGEDAGKDYGSDFSNAALFRFHSTVDRVANITINNMALIGNSARDNLVDATENLASAGGLIFFKSSIYTNTTMDNVIGNSYFITYFTENTTTLTVTNSKCYDSYQNAAFVWGDSIFNLIDSYVNGCGGPAVIAQSVWEENAHPIVNVTGGEMETHLSGREIWFTAVSATAIVDSIKLLGAGLHQAGLGNFVDANGQMNIQAALMAKGTDATDIVTRIDAQGSILVNGSGMNRFQTAENVQWAYIKGITEQALASGLMPPFLTVYDAAGNAYTLYSDGVNLYDLAGNQLGTDASHQAYMVAFATANSITLTQGGLSVILEFYHY